jgi:methyl-accepting chemotaxis protein
MTQQNAALVEEATAASQSMADQARDLNQMMNRYRIDDSAASGWVSSPTQRANVAAATGTLTKAPKVERRSASRPWSKAPAKAAAAVEAAADSGHKKVVGSASSDSDWQEF